MKRILVLWVALVAFIPVFAQQVNDPNAEVREAKGYHGITIGDAFDVYLTQSGEEAVAVSAAETKYRDKIKVEVKDGILYVRYERDKKLSWGGDKKKLKAYISFKMIDKLNISGACDVFVSGTIKADALVIHQSGASDLKGKLDVNKLTVDLSGASDIMVTGTTMQISVEASGASSFKGYDLITDVCNAHASGASDIKITVNKELSVHSTGASDIRYKGNGVIREIKTSGSSSVSKG